MRKRLVVGLLAAVIVAGLVIAKRHELVRFAIASAASVASGYRVTIGDQRIGIDESALLDVHVSRDGVPLLDARRIDVRYSLRDLLPGSTRRFGLVSLELDDAKLTVVKFNNGTYNFLVPPPPAGGLPVPPAPPVTIDVPIRFDLTMHDAQLELREPVAYDTSAKDILIHQFNVDASVDTATVTHYTATGAFRAQHDMPFTIAGTIDAVRSFAMHRARAKRFPLRALANYFADSPAVRILRGGARNFDARLYSLDVRPNVPPSYHANLALDIENGALGLQALDAPIESIDGHLQLVDNVVFLRHLHAALAGIPLHLAGGIFDLTGDAQLRLGVYGTGELAKLRNAFTFTKKEPVSGNIALGVLVQGPVGNPMIVAHGVAARAVYRQVPFERLDARVIYRDNVVSLAPLRAVYGGTDVAIRGALQIGKHLQSDIALHMTGSAQRLPYLDEMLGDEPIVVDAAATGTDLNFRVAGTAASALGISRVAALVELNPNGTGLIDPFWFHTERGNFDGGYVLDRPDATSAFWGLASGLQMHAPAHAVFPGVTLPEIPKVNGRIESIAVAGGGAGRDVAIAGRFSAGKSDIAGVHFDSIHAGFGGTMTDAHIGMLHASGPWGRFDGNGGFSTQAFVADGRYAGTFEGLQPFLGSAIPGRGALSGPVSIAVEPKAIVVQASHLAMSGATLRGVPVSTASITLAVEGDRLRVYSAHASAAGGDVVAAGTYDVGAHPRANNGTLSLVVSGLNGAQLHGIGLPLDAGRLFASGNLSAGAPLPTFAGGVNVAGGRVQKYHISGEGDVLLAGQTASLSRVIGALGSTYAHVSGNIDSLASGAPAYALDAQVPAGNIAATLHELAFPSYMTVGTFNARLRIGGTGVAPLVNGQVGVPAGAVNGLPFIDGSTHLDADTRGVSARDGRVLVGTTEATFSATARAPVLTLHVAAPRADLSDFNNFFDTGDTLDGDGSLRFALASDAEHFSTSGDIDVTGFRYRNLPIGDTRAYWSSAQGVVKGAIAIGGSEGTLSANGSVGLTPGADLFDTFTQSRYDITASVRNLDLSLWVPALGFTSIPIIGRASGDAVVRGRFPLVDLRGSASIAGGSIGPLSLDSAKATIHSVGRRIAIDSAELATTGLSATASGTLGLKPTDPLDVQVHAQTDDVPRLVYEFTRTKIPIAGSFESTVQVGGTFKAPTLSAGVDGTNVQAYGLSIPSLFGQVALHGKTLVLSNAGATFTKGEATLAGSLPLQLSPFRIGPSNQSVNFDVDLTGVDPAIFQTMLGSNTKLGGTIDGHFGLTGTIGAPIVNGFAALSNGSYVSDLERTPITNATARLRFNRTNAAIDRVSAKLGNGTIAGSGRVEFPNGFEETSGYSFVAKAIAKSAQLDLPAYGSGTLDADVALTKTPSSHALLAGKVTLTNATLPFSAFINATQKQPGAVKAPLPPIAFDLTAVAGKNVRVRGNGYGAGLDIGTAGAVRLGGTLNDPTLDGTIKSTNGTLTYFDRAFRVQSGQVTFDPSAGIAPTIHAVASTNVVNPDPDRARNPYGSAQITINVDGPIEGLKIGFTTNPPGYTQDQIIAMIAPFGGFIGGIAFNNQSPLQVQSPGGFTPLGALSPVPNGLYQTRSNTITVGQEAFNILNAQFAAGLLAPLETAVGQGLGLSSVNLSLGYYGNVGVQATRVLGKSVSAVYATTFGLPQVTSFGLQIEPSQYTTATLSFFYQTGPTKLFQVPGAAGGSSNPGLLLGESLLGTSGFSFTLQRYL